MSEIVVPPGGWLVATIKSSPDDWELYRLPQQPAKGSPLWVELKLIARGVPRKRGSNRVFHLCWGVDAKRLRRDGGAGALARQFPEVYEAVDRCCRERLTAAALEARIGAAALAAERERVASVSRKPAKPAPAAPAVDIFS